MSRATDQIIDLLNAGRTGEAVELLETHGGPFFGFIHGYDSLNLLVASTSEDILFSDEVLLSCYCFALVKAGRARRATAILEDKRDGFRTSFLRDLMELAVFIHTSDPVTESQFARWKQLEGRLPIGEPLYDGLYCNCMAIVLVRLNLVKQARSVAIRSLEGFRQARQPGLEFFIYVHLAHMAILEGDIRTARRETRMARAYVMEDDAFHVSGMTFVEILESAIAWETGQATPDRASFVALRRKLLSGDSWAEIFVELCRVAAFSIYFSEGLAVSLDYLDESQVDFHRRHGEFSDALDVIAASVELLDGRADRAQHYASVNDSQLMLGATGTIVLNGIRGKLDVDDMLQPAPSGTGASARFAVTTELIKASRAKENRDKALHRRHVQNAMRLSANDGLVGLFLEHREVVVGVSSYLATGKFARGHIQLGRMARRVHNLVRASYLMPAPLSGRGVTSQQMRVLSALREGASNKQIARKLGLSEAAIKYHLGRLFAKFQVSKRGQLIEKIDEIMIF